MKVLISKLQTTLQGKVGGKNPKMIEQITQIYIYISLDDIKKKKRKRFKN